ncbi:glycosyltransferase [Candidatus Symbiopectobacterium sp. NZEC135]|uniref:glycosyltransferase n=1 Tax=Candidatus Symbiopectobacterium sp. NZEC135 TaxID=2820471 RepID=UPI0022270A55|nr:glycosyltransferase [Candidatus Symbiopectobacterium sp. NZEC135]MCW2481604.1 glycosyltransferase [Candidatus Symbiopectobacterium sp. NZEC135]
MRKNIVYVITKPETGGAQKWIYEQKKMLDGEYNIFLITSGNGWLTEQFDNHKVFLIPSLTSIKKPIALYYLILILKKIKADVVVSSSANAGFYARLAKIFFPHKSIYVSHGWSCIYNGGKFKSLFCFVEKLLSYFTDELLCVSKSDRRKAIDTIGVKSQKITVISNTVTPMLTKQRVLIPKKVLFLGRMVYPKRPDLLASVALLIPCLDFYFVGDGSYVTELKSKYKDAKNIFFLGEVKNFISFNEYDIFVLCSDSEGLPMSAIEAGSAGIPLILSDVGGCHELVYTLSNGNSNGLLFNNDVNNLRFTIENMVNNYPIFSQAAQDVMRNYNIQFYKNEYINLFEKG